MTIRKGQSWGTAGGITPGSPVVGSDDGARRQLQQMWSGQDERSGPPEVGILGGDLHRTLGAPRHDEADLLAGRATRFPMDLGTVRVDDGPEQVFVAHLIATASPSGRLWSSRTVIAMNGSFAGGLNLGPRAHPNDGRLDIVDGELPRPQRRTGRRRALTGSHVPHPDLAERRSAHLVIDSDRPLHLLLDGVTAGSGTRLELCCHPDAWIAVA